MHDSLFSAPLAWIAAAVLVVAPRHGGAALLAADPSTGSSIVVHATKAGLLSGLAHDHRLVPERWRTDVDYDAGDSGSIDVRIVVDAASLRETTTRPVAISFWISSSGAGFRVQGAAAFRQARPGPKATDM
jgi:hypothetical protein